MWGRLIIVVSCLAALAGPGRSATPPLASSIDEIARAALAGGLPGLSIGVAFRGGTLLRAYGLAATSPAVPARPETIFHIASVSKPLLAAAVLKLVETGRVRLDDDIRAYVPEAPTAGRHVTIAELLNHTSGIASYTSAPDAAAKEALDLDHAAVLKLFAGRPFDFAPGTSWRYDNSGFYLAGMLVERVGGRPYGRSMRERVFAPLGMTSTSMCDRREAPPRLAPGHVLRSGKLSDAPPMSWRLPFAAGGLCSTAGDLLTWQRALDTGRLIGPAMVSRMRQPTRLPDGMTVDYGFGTRIGSLQGRPVVGHTGTGGGYSAVLERFPADDLTIVVLANVEPAPVTEIAASIARAALSLPTPTLPDLPPPAALVSAATGLFDSDEGPIEQAPCGARLCVSPPGHAQDGLPLKWQGGTEFALTPDDQVRYFLRDGKVMWGELYSGGLMIDAKRRVR